MTRDQIEIRLQKSGVAGRVWGRNGAEAVAEVEGFLGQPLALDLKHFIEGVGNVSIGPFDVVLAGNEAGTYGAVTESQGLPVDLGRALKLLDHAGESYIYFPKDGTIAAFEGTCLHHGTETLRFSNLAAFLDWLFEEAAAMQSDGKTE